MRNNSGYSTTGGQGLFAEAPARPHPRSLFNRSCGRKTAFNTGLLIPVFLDLALPGDTYNLKATVFARLQTTVRPLMDNIYADIQFFFVPMRLLWSNFQKFMGEVDPGDTTEYLFPTLDAPSGGFAEESLADHLGIPPGVELTDINALPFRAVNLIWNTWYRAQDLQDQVPVPLDDGPDDPADYVLLPRGKRHDYFTSCLPFPQKGGVDVLLPLGSTAPVVPDATGYGTYDVPGGASGIRLAAEGGSADARWSAVGGAAANVTIATSGLEADLSNATSASVNDFRQAIAMQQLLEREARTGTRYIELVRSAFGVRSSDARLMNPEFLGGATSQMHQQAVPQSFNNSVVHEFVGDLGAYGTAVIPRRGFVKTIEEHGYVIGFVSVRADLNYQQGLARHWNYSTKFDLPWPEFHNLGEQEVLNKEIYAQADANDDLVFGYQERYAEYRYKPSETVGLMRSTAALSLDVWHLAQEFSTLPQLDDAFIQESPPVDRVLADTQDAEILADCFFELAHARPLPVHSVPGLMRF